MHKWDGGARPMQSGDADALGELCSLGPSESKCKCDNVQMCCASEATNHFYILISLDDRGNVSSFFKKIFL